MERPIDAQTETCVSCHAIERESGFFGSNGVTTFEGESQLFKIAHLRNIYQKIGMFGIRDNPLLTSVDETPFGPQVRGFGLIHEGSVDTVDNFLRVFVFIFADQDPITLESPERRAVAEFMMVAPSDVAPIVGQQVTLTPSEPTTGQREQLAVLRARAAAPQVRVGGGMEYECDLIANAVVRNGENDEARGYVWDVPSGRWQSDRLAQRLTHEQLVGLLAGSAPATDAITFTCVVPGTGYRAGVDRDSDFALDRDELDAQTDPRSAASVPAMGLMPGSLPPLDLGVSEPTVCLTRDAGPRVDSGTDAGVDAGTETPSSGGSSGCGCRVAEGQSVSWPAPLLGIGLLLVGRWRRRSARNRREA
jgi:MYXO-CTERM domain-containing protein